MSKIENLMREFESIPKGRRAGSGVSQAIREFLTKEIAAGSPICKITAKDLGLKDFGMGPVYKILKELGIPKENYRMPVTDEVKHRAEALLVKLA